MALTGAAFLTDLALVITVAAVATLICHRLRQPVIVGYLLAGVLISPAGPLPTVDAAELGTLAQLGIVFLMFGIGLEFRLQRLARAGWPAMGAALAGLGAFFLAALALGRFLGWSAGDALVLGAVLGISSTVIAAKAMHERGATGQRWHELALAILIAQDVLAVGILALLGSKPSGLDVLDVLGELGRLATFAIMALVLGLLVVPRLVNRLARERADEVLIVTLAALAVGVAVLALLLGFSPALGAFLIGAVVAEASEAWVAERRILPLRNLFTAVFFVSIGTLLDPDALLANWRLIAALGLLTVTLKVAVHFLAGALLGARPRDAFKAGLAVANVGEFSFVIAGLATGALAAVVLPATVALAIGSALWAPYLVKHGDALWAFGERRVPRSAQERFRAYEHRARARLQRARLPAELRHRATRTGMNAAAVVLLLLATSGASQAFASWVSVGGLTDRSLIMLPWLGGGILALPFAFNAARAAAGQHAPARARASAGLLLGTAAIVCSAFLVAGPFAMRALPPLPLLLLLLAAFLGAGVLLWESVSLLHGRVEQALEDALGGLAQGEERRAVLEQLRAEYRAGAQVETARVQPDTAAAGSTLRALNLRARTGATLLAVQRGGRTLVNPGPDFVLITGDALVLLGEPAQLDTARAALSEAPRWEEAEQPGMARIQLRAGSPLVGRTIAEGRLRERTGTTIIAVLRGPERLASPGPGLVLQEGDALVVMGALSELRRAEDLAGPEPASAPVSGASPTHGAERPNA
ncbi:MAG: cation:proton antiporter [Halobacteriales archaeon]|nr:cation:proton antiporter [Halobacteriales archaeon]